MMIYDQAFRSIKKNRDTISRHDCRAQAVEQMVRGGVMAFLLPLPRLLKLRLPQFPYAAPAAPVAAALAAAAPAPVADG
jgi:hypothetical protein